MMWYLTDGQVLDPAAADEHDRVLLQVVPDARDVGRDLHLVGQAHAGDLAQRGVRLLGRHRAHLKADAALLRGARDRHLALPQAVPVLAHGRRLDLGDLALAAVAHELADRRHEDAAPFRVVGRWSVGDRPVRRSRRSRRGGRRTGAVDVVLVRWVRGARAEGGPLPRPRTRSVSAARRRVSNAPTGRRTGRSGRPRSGLLGRSSRERLGVLQERGSPRRPRRRRSRASVAEERVGRRPSSVAAHPRSSRASGKARRLVVGRRRPSPSSRNGLNSVADVLRAPRRRGPRGPPGARAPCGPRRSPARPSRPG